MNTLYSILVSVDVLLAIGIIGLILIQHGKGADVGAAFGSGASGTVFGSQGSASFLTRVTAILATLFFINSLVLAYLASNRPVTESVIDNVEQTEMVAPATTSDVPEANATSSDIPDDLPSDAMDAEMKDADPAAESDVPEVPGEVESESEAVMNKTLDKVQDSVEEIKESVENTLDNVTPDDVPE